MVPYLPFHINGRFGLFYRIVITQKIFRHKNLFKYQFLLLYWCDLKIASFCVLVCVYLSLCVVMAKMNLWKDLRYLVLSDRNERRERWGKKREVCRTYIAVSCKHRKKLQEVPREDIYPLILIFMKRKNFTYGILDYWYNLL